MFSVLHVTRPFAKKSEVDAVPETARLVEVAFDVVAFSAVKFWSVVEPSVWKLVEKRLVAVRAVELAYVIVVAPVSEKKEEVARAVGTAEPLVMLARMELAAMAESPAVPAEYVMPLLNVVVAESNFEKEALVRQPKTEADAMSQVTAPDA